MANVAPTQFVRSPPAKAGRPLLQVLASAFRPERRSASEMDEMLQRLDRKATDRPR